MAIMTLFLSISSFKTDDNAMFTKGDSRLIVDPFPTNIN